MNKKNLFLILGLSLPLLMIFIILLVIYIPNYFYHPTFNFIYSLDRQYSSDLYFIQNKKIALQQNQSIKSAPSQLFYYDVKQDKSQDISFEQAQQFTLDPNPISPDGYQVNNGGGVDGFFPLLFIADDRAGVYLNGHNANRKLNIGTYQNAYWGFHFIGWVIHDTNQ